MGESDLPNRFVHGRVVSKRVSPVIPQGEKLHCQPFAVMAARSWKVYIVFL